MRVKPFSERAVSLWAFIAGLEGILTVIILTRNPSEAESIVAFGLSSQRLLIVAGCFILALFFLVIAVAHLYQSVSWNKTLNRKPDLLRYVLALTVIFEIVTFHILFLIPDYHFPKLSEYISRLKPIFLWFALVFLQTFILLTIFGYLSNVKLIYSKFNITILIILLSLGLIWGLIALTGIGVTPDEFYWNVAGVPLLSWQVWVAIGITLFVWFLISKLTNKKQFSKFTSFTIFIGIWVITAVVWIKTPMTPTFNAPGPYLPSNEFYPFVDAALFDLGAQSALYGKGIFYGAFNDRSLLSGFLAITHMFFGQSYSKVVGVQSAIYAVFPALLYLVGKKLHSNAAGVFVAILAIFKGTNSIFGGKFISTSHPKLMLTEFPTGIILILFSLFLVLWLYGKGSKKYYLAGMGASIGTGILLRHNAFFLFPAFFALGIAIWKWRWKHALRDTTLVLGAFFITISPWMWRNQRVAGEPFFFLAQFNRVIEERYLPQSHIEQNKTVSNYTPRALTNRTLTSRTEKTNLIELNQYHFIPKHFMHNLITSVLVLPPSPVLDDLRRAVEKYPYWGRIENMDVGDISVPLGIFLALNLTVLSIGFGASWKRIGKISLTPLVVFLFYSLANAFARTSGGRYVVPIDWVIYLYFAIGLVEILQFSITTLGFQTYTFFELKDVKYSSDHPSQKIDWKKTGLITLPFFLLVSTLPLIEFTSPGAKSPDSPELLIQQLDKTFFFETSGLSRSEVEDFLGNPEALILSGRGLYPRYYSYDQGEPILPNQITPYTSREFPRLVFTLLLPNGEKPIWLPFEDPKLRFPDAAEVIVAGCRVNQSNILVSYLNYIDAVFVVILDDPMEIHVRSPEAPLTCPLRTPVCDNNHNCK